MEALIKLCTLVTIMSSLSSCRPPSFGEEWQRNPQIQRDQEMPGQKPMSLDLVNVGDNRPEYIRNADNPDYKPDSNIIKDTIDWVFGGNSTPPPNSQVKIDPPPAGADNIDIYDIKGGKVDTSSGMVDPNDPDIVALRESAKNTGNEFGNRQFLLEQRDYARSRSEQLVNDLSQKQIDPFSKEIEQKLNAMKGEVDAAVNGHNQSVNGVLAQTPENQNLPKAEGYEFKTAPYSENGQRVRAVQQSVNYAKGVVAQMSGDTKARGEAAISIAQNAVIAADKAYAAGDQAGGDFALEIATTVVDVGLGLIPGVGLAKDAIEAATGYSIVTGKKLSGFERTMAVVGVLTAGYGSKLALVGKVAILSDVLKAGKAAEEGAEIARATTKATEIVEAAEKIAVKEKGIIDEIGEAVKEGFPCKIAVQGPMKIREIIFGLLIDTAFAANCDIPDGAEKAVKDTLESFGPQGGKALPKMTPAQVSRSTKIDNTIRDHAKPSDFEGVAKELKGEKIPDGNGGFFDHITEMKESKGGLEKHSGALKDSLRNPNLDSDVRTFIQGQVNRADDVISRMADALAGKT